MRRCQSRTHYKLKLRPLCAVVLACFAAVGAAAAEPGDGIVTFNSVFLRQLGNTGIDLTQFSKGNAALPGDYLADTYVNQAWVGRIRISLKQAQSGRVETCMDRELLERAGIDLGKLPASALELLEKSSQDSELCVTLPQLVDDATATFDNGEQRLDLSIPQAMLNRRARGYVDPQFWDNGVTSALVQYNSNFYRNSGSFGASTQAYLGLTVGLNVGPWRFRHTGNLNSSTRAGTAYQAVQTSLQRSIVPLKSQFTEGDAFTDGAMFDSVGFRGMSLASDDRMYPESQRGYAPVIRGVARSNALVQVLQNGNVLYETNVAPGPFDIDDLYPTGYGGNLQVVVTEADGTKSTTLVPYAAAPNALRPGLTRYNVTAGEYRSALVDSHPLLFQATVQHGFTNLITGYGGVAYTTGYVAVMAGTALNTPVGAFGIDIAHARTTLGDHSTHSGQSLRISYSKYFAPTDTNVSVAAYQYSSGGYLGLADAIATRSTGYSQNGEVAGARQRNSLQITLNQALPEGWGSVYFTGTGQNYWNKKGAEAQFSAGYNNTFRRISYGVMFGRQYDLTSGHWDNRVMVTASIPLGTKPRSPMLSTNMQRSSRGGENVQTMVSGSLGEDSAFNYGISAGYSNSGTTGSATGGANVSYRSPVAAVTANVSTGSGYTQYGAGLSGSVVAYRGGIATSPLTGDTMAVVEAKDAGGARVTTQSGVRIDRWGHALVPGLTPFSRNEIGIDPKGLPVSVEFKSTSQPAVPTAGAVVVTHFETSNPGRSVIFNVTVDGSEPVPFGADVRDESGQSVGTVAQGGHAIVRGLKAATGELVVQWGSEPRQMCRLEYELADAKNTKAATWANVDAICRAAGRPGLPATQASSSSQPLR
ncbi:outer membrane usher protein [Paraburkholderia silvatlantica]|nr:outer membrane usher protein [Paraburkholderia silvatlantica]PXW23245.1 outer membrane usher protein [Paraburkholderia silvatlantica]